MSENKTVKVKLWASLGFVQGNRKDIQEVGADLVMTDGKVDEDKLDKYAKEWLWNYLDLDAEILENDDSDD